MPEHVAVMTCVLALGAITLPNARERVVSIRRNARVGVRIPLVYGATCPTRRCRRKAGVPNLIADMNAQRLAFSVHDGDLKQGSGSPCDEALCNRSLGYFNALEAPAMFTPGDNDWTDCDRPANGGFPHWIGWTTSDGCSSAHPIHWASGGCRRRCRQTRSAVASAARLCLRREPALDDAGRDLRDDEHPGLVQ